MNGLGHLTQFIAAQAVATRIADVGDHDAFFDEKRTDACRPHAVVFGIFARRAMDDGIGANHRSDESSFFAALGLATPGGPQRQIDRRLLFERLFVERFDFVNRHSRCHFARLMPAHAIGDDDKRLRLRNEEAILVVIANHTRIC